MTPSPASTLACEYPSSRRRFSGVGQIALLVSEIAQVALGAETRRNHIGLAEGTAFVDSGIVGHLRAAHHGAGIEGEIRFGHLLAKGVQNARVFIYRTEARRFAEHSGRMSRLAGDSEHPAGGGAPADGRGILALLVLHDTFEAQREIASLGRANELGARELQR